ncbi:hypothetical protein NLI96_g257 [Meripilus lineatus]|uniref:Fe2OG dioxygenase domain-containing protein n=1 Tax=Meripilus lineatus TaxID=2056292 RepID=A0AAD5VGS1_9APHY|nr:hypothetical protein NLI96_g257 [Physisporinus lineatus]
MLEKLEALRDSIVEKPPYRAGILDVDPENLILFYGKSQEARRIDFNNVTPKELEHLANTCDPATFGLKNENVSDERYRKAGKLDTKHFASRLDLGATRLLNMALDDLLEGGRDVGACVEAEIYKLNVYGASHTILLTLDIVLTHLIQLLGEGSFFKAHVDTPRGSNMFGSLVIIFRTVRYLPCPISTVLLAPSGSSLGLVSRIGHAPVSPMYMKLVDANARRVPAHFSHNEPLPSGTFFESTLYTTQFTLARLEDFVFLPETPCVTALLPNRDVSLFAGLPLSDAVLTRTPHEGGSLIVRDHGQEWIFDSAEAVAKHEKPCLGYVAFYSDVEHEVTPVTKGYRVTLTYNLYFIESPDRRDHLHLEGDSENIKVKLQALLDDSSFLPCGGYLGFGLNRQYPVSNINVVQDFCDVVDNLKGSDAALMAACDSLSVKTVARVAVRTDEMKDDVYVLSEMMHFRNLDLTGSSIFDYLREYDGLVLNGWRDQDDTSDDSDSILQRKAESYYTSDSPRPDVNILWANKFEGHAMLRDSVAIYGNEPTVEYLYAYICLIALVGPYGARNAETWKGKNDEL